MFLSDLCCKIYPAQYYLIKRLLRFTSCSSSSVIVMEILRVNGARDADLSLGFLCFS